MIRVVVVVVVFVLVVVVAQSLRTTLILLSNPAKLPFFVQVTGRCLEADRFFAFRVRPRYTGNSAGYHTDESTVLARAVPAVVAVVQW